MRQKLISNVIIAGNLWEKCQGLIGAKKSFRLLIKTRFGIHTYGVKFPIDVVVLDRGFIVKAIRKSLQPNRIFFWKPIYDKLLELPQGEVKELGIKEGQQLKLFPARKRIKAGSSL